ncbi:unnamed protein product [Brassica oleracea var. botrytis]
MDLEFNPILYFLGDVIFLQIELNPRVEISIHFNPRVEIRLTFCLDEDDATEALSL